MSSKSRKRKSNIFTVDQILDDRPSEQAGGREYLIRWDGYDASSDTWEPEANIMDEDLLNEYKKSKKEQRSANGQATDDPSPSDRAVYRFCALCQKFVAVDPELNTAFPCDPTDLAKLGSVSRQEEHLYYRLMLEHVAKDLQYSKCVCTQSGCDTHFVREEDLLRHKLETGHREYMRTPGGNSMFDVFVCSLAFRNLGDMKKHTADEKIVKTDLDNMCENQADRLLRSFGGAYNSKILQCASKIVASSCPFTTVVGSLSFDCKLCVYQTSMKLRLKQHMKKEHKEGLSLLDNYVESLVF